MMGTFFSFLFALLILVVTHEAAHFGVARYFGVRVLRFSFGFGKVLFRFYDRKQTEYTWSLIPLGGYVKMLDENAMPVLDEEKPYAFNRKPAWVRFLIVLAGPLSNFVLAFALSFVVFFVGIKIPVVSSTIGHVAQGTPAFHAGLKSEDVIMAINGVSVRQGKEIVSMVQQHPDKKIQLTLLRQHKPLEIEVILDHDPHIPSNGQLGIALKNDLNAFTVYRQPFFHALAAACNSTWQMTKQTFLSIGQLIQGHLPLAELSGPVGIAKLAGESVTFGFTHYLMFIALVSVSLGVLNLLPIPLLDGGYLAYYLVEFVIRRPLSQRAQQCAGYVGFCVIFFMTVVAFKNDLARLGW